MLVLHRAAEADGARLSLTRIAAESGDELWTAADLPIARVADALGIPVGTAKSRLHAALERLRAELAGHDG